MLEFSEETSWSDMLAEYRRAAGLSKSALARLVGVSIGYISKLESGKRPPPEYQRNLFCEALGLDERASLSFHIKAELERADPVTIKYLLKMRDETSGDSTDILVSDYVNVRDNRISADDSEYHETGLHRIPIINKTAAGYPQEFTDLDYPVGIADSYISVPDVTDPNAFGFYVSGDSMEPDFPDGTLLIASPNTIPFDGDPCFVRFSPVCKVDGCTFKRAYFTKDNRIRLVPINRRYEEQVYPRDEITGLWPVIRSYVKVNRNPDGLTRRKPNLSGRTSERGGHRASAAG